METLPWYPDEAICTKTPTTKWQRRIARYVKKGVFKFMDFYWTANMLNNQSRFTRTSKGLNPDIPVGELRAIRS